MTGWLGEVGEYKPGGGGREGVGGSAEVFGGGYVGHDSSEIRPWRSFLICFVLFGSGEAGDQN